MRGLRGVPIICVCGQFGSDLSCGFFKYSAARPYATARPDVMYSIRNCKSKVRITNILFTLTLFFKHYLCKMVL